MAEENKIVPDARPQPGSSAGSEPLTASDAPDAAQAGSEPAPEPRAPSSAKGLTPGQSVEAVFLERMREAFPERMRKIFSRLREVRNGALTEGSFFRRQRGTGAYWDMIEQLFDVHKRRAGFPEDDLGTNLDTFLRPGFDQATLFDREGHETQSGILATG